jgi:adenylylsulfate kinase-like enzyme
VVMVLFIGERSLEICEARDPKGNYKKARAGKIPEFTGISAPYEPSKNHELTVPTGTKELNTCVQQVITELIKHDLIVPSESLNSDTIANYFLIQYNFHSSTFQ